MNVSVFRRDPSVPLPKYETPGSAGFDLAASADVTIEPGAIALVPTGLVIGVPPGHLLGIFARSSTPLKKGLMVANGVGVVDSDYCGPDDEVKVQVLNFTKAAVTVRRGRPDRAGCDSAVRTGRVEGRHQRRGPDSRGIRVHRVISMVMTSASSSVLRKLGIDSTNRGACYGADGWIDASAARLSSLNPATGQEIARRQSRDAGVRRSRGRRSRPRV